MKILYSLKKEEVLIQNGVNWEDFAENLWSPTDKYFKAMFLPAIKYDLGKKSRTKKGQKKTRSQRAYLGI